MKNEKKKAIVTPAEIKVVVDCFNDLAFTSTKTKIAPLVTMPVHNRIRVR
ncbi:hypothetical protein [Lacibacter luteus]|nr:hypothetical protein [Lacibacter luteus]